MSDRARRPLSIYQRRRAAKSPYIRYDKSRGLWIQHRKIVYLYWFKFLQHADRDEHYKVDWHAYESWGGHDVVMDSKFDDWWSLKWETLFGFPKGQPTQALWHTTSTPRAEDLRTTLLIYENLHRGDYWTVGCFVKRHEEQRGRKIPKSLTYADHSLWTAPSSDEKCNSGVSRWRDNPRIRQMTSGDALVERRERWITLNPNDDRTRDKYLDWEARQSELTENRNKKRRVQGYVSAYVKRCHSLMERISAGTL